MSEVLLKRILGNAVKIEEKSYDLYTKAQAKASPPSSKGLLAELAQADPSMYLSILNLYPRKCNLFVM